MRRLGDLKLSHPDYVLIAIRKDNDWIFNPPADFELQAPHVMIVMASPKGRDALVCTLQEASVG
jgi:uncharacterized protein with PhoU and TrkA domain